MAHGRVCITVTALIILTIGATSNVMAQARTTSVLVGTVTDDTGGVLPGATVTIQSPNLVGGTQTTVTDGDGSYRFPALPAGTYSLLVELDGLKTVNRTDIHIELATTVTIDVQMTVANINETVTVVGAVPVVDVKSAAPNTTLDNRLLQSLPTGRFQPDMIDLAPGVNASVAFGGAQTSNALLIDGVDISDPLAGSPWSFFNYNWIEEVQVVALGADAEYGEFTGVAANSLVRSGSNKWQGLLEYVTTRENWLSDNTTDLPEELRATFKPDKIESNYDTSAQIGGPIVKDRLFFFTGFEYLKDKSTPAGCTGPTSTEAPRFIGKMTWAAAQNVRVEGFFQKDKFDVTGRGCSPVRPPETTVIEPSPETNWNGKLTWTINANTLLEVRNGGYDGTFNLEPTPPNTRSGPPGHFDTLTGLYSVNTYYFVQRDRTRNTTAAVLTKYVDGFLGRNHAFKFGFEFERSNLRDEVGYPGGKLYYDYGGVPYAATLWDGYVLDGVGKRTSLYAQDTWTLNDRVTLNPGIRFNFNRGSVPGQGTVLSTNPVSPRIGIAWDVIGNHKTVLRAHYGRYFDALLGSTYQFMDTTQQPPRISALLLAEGGCANGLGPDCEEVGRFTPEGNFGIDDQITHSYVDQFVLGLERELFPTFSLQVQYIKRNFRNFMGFIDTRAQYAPVERPDPGPDGEIGTGDDQGLITVFNRQNPDESFRELTNPDGATRDYDAFQIVGRKRYGNNWQLNSSYTWSRSDGIVSNEFTSNAAGGGDVENLGQTGIFANPNVRINQNGRSTFDYTHQLKLEGTYHLPALGGFDLSALYRYTSGLAWGRRANIVDLDQISETIRIEPRGTRRTDAINRLDLRVEKIFPIASQARTIGLAFDIFNLTNQGVIDNANGDGIQDTSGPHFGEPLAWTIPRQLRVLLRFTF
jgi:hypothetical protein